MKRKTIFILLMLIIIPLNIQIVNATTINDYKKQLEDLKKQKQENEENKAKIQQQVEDAKKQIDVIGEQIILQTQEQDVISQEITKNELDIKEKKEQIKDLIVFTQKSSSENFYLNYLFGAENFTDFIFQNFLLNLLF